MPEKTRRGWWGDGVGEEVLFIIFFVFTTANIKINTIIIVMGVVAGGDVRKYRAR